MHRDGITLCGEEDDLHWIADQMTQWFEIKIRAKLGPGINDDEVVVILGRTMGWCPGGQSGRRIPSIELLMESFDYKYKIIQLESIYEQKMNIRKNMESGFSNILQ